MRVDDKLRFTFGLILAVAVIFIGATLLMFFLFMEEIQILPIAIVAGLGLVFLSFVGFMWNKLKLDVAEPVSKLAQQAERLANGEANAALNDMKAGELGDIADALNKIFEDTAELKKFVDSLLREAVSDAAMSSTPKGMGRTFSQIADATNKLTSEHTSELNEVTAAIERMNSGDINPNMRMRNNKNISHALDKLNKTLHSLQNDMGILSNSFKDGNFQTSVFKDKYEGKWKTMLQGVSAVGLAVCNNIRQVEEGLNQMARGTVNNRIKIEGRGDFAQLVTTLNNSLGTLERKLNSINTDILGIASKQRPRGEYLGDFAKIRSSLESLLDKQESSPPNFAATRAVNLSTTPASERRAKGDANRMSGAKKVTDYSKIPANVPFMRSDYGKY